MVSTALISLFRFPDVKSPQTATVNILQANRITVKTSQSTEFGVRSVDRSAAVLDVSRATQNNLFIGGWTIADDWPGIVRLVDAQ